MSYAHVASAAAPLKVLVWAVVAEPARQTMSQALWTKDIDAYVGGNAIAFAGPSEPTVADCRAAGADYAIAAPFDLRPNLPGLPSSGGRVAARSHIVVTNCITGTTTLDQTVFFVSDAPSAASEGDFDSVPEITWARGVPAALAKIPLAFERIARVMQVNAPFALVDIKAGRIHAGDGLRDFASSDHKLRATPIVLTVTQTFDKYLEVVFSGSGDRPGVGDLVEPLPKSPTPASPTTRMPQATSTASPDPASSATPQPASSAPPRPASTTKPTPRG